MYVIMNAGRYVARPVSKSSFTRDIARAQKFETREAAEANACGNEHVVPLRLVWGE